LLNRPRDGVEDLREQGVEVDLAPHQLAEREQDAVAVDARPTVGSRGLLARPWLHSTSVSE
jgi:hypothetical protein